MDSIDGGFSNYGPSDPPACPNCRLFPSPPSAEDTPLSSACQITSIQPYSGAPPLTPAGWPANYGARVPGWPSNAVAATVEAIASDRSPDCDAGIDAGSDPLAADQLFVTQVDANGASISTTCLSCYPDAGSNAPDVWRYKKLPSMRPQGDWILVGVEDATSAYPNGGSNPTPFITQCSPLSLQVVRNNGYYTSLWVVKPDGSQWVQLTTPSMFPTQGDGISGFLAPRWSPDGTKIVISKTYNSPDKCPGPAPDDACTDTNPNLQGYWDLYVAQFNPGPPPSITIPMTNVTLANDVFYEPQTFSQNSEALIVQSNTEDVNSYGLDLYLIDLSNLPTSWTYTNLTNSPYSWDEHAAYSTGGNTIAWISGIPFDGYSLIQQYGYLPWSTFRDNLQTEMFIMNMGYALDGGSGPLLQQVSHFNTPCTGDGVPYADCGTAQFGDAMFPTWSGDGTQLLVHNGSPEILVPGGNSAWLYTFAGQCGN
jgi:Tol biopolymer transport system component